MNRAGILQGKRDKYHIDIRKRKDNIDAKREDFIQQLISLTWIQKYDELTRDINNIRMNGRKQDNQILEQHLSDLIKLLDQCIPSDANSNIISTLVQIVNKQNENRNIVTLSYKALLLFSFKSNHQIPLNNIPIQHLFLRQNGQMQIMNLVGNIILSSSNMGQITTIFMQKNIPNILFQNMYKYHQLTKNERQQFILIIESYLLGLLQIQNNFRYNSIHCFLIKTLKRIFIEDNCLHKNTKLKIMKLMLLYKQEYDHIAFVQFIQNNDLNEASIAVLWHIMQKTTSLRLSPLIIQMLIQYALSRTQHISTVLQILIRQVTFHKQSTSTIFHELQKPRQTNNNYETMAFEIFMSNIEELAILCFSLCKNDTTNTFAELIQDLDNDTLNQRLKQYNIEFFNDNYE